MKLFFLLLLPMLALSSMLGDKESDAVEAQTPWGNVRVSIELEKPTTMLGEPTSLVYKIENQTDRELFTTYGLTRNAYGRPQNFEVVAVGENGQEVELLTLGPHQCFGGLLGSHPIPKGKSWSKKLYLPKWFVLKHPGTYSIQCRTPSCIATTNQAALAHDSAVESPKQTKSPRKEIENVTIVDVDLSTVLKVVPADDKKMGQLIESPLSSPSGIQTRLFMPVSGHSWPRKIRQ